LTFAGCHEKNITTYSETPTGLKYRFYIQNRDVPLPFPGDLVTADVVFRTDDTIFFISSEHLSIPYQFEMLPPQFQGDMYEALMLMGVGDSASFIIKGDSLFIRDFEIQELPGFINPGTDVVMDVRLIGIKSAEEFKQEKKAYGERVEKMMDELRKEEQTRIMNFLDEYGIEIKPLPSGLYYIEEQSGTGPVIKKGNIVKVDYSAMFISGEIFETTKRDIAIKNNIFDSAMTYRPFEYLHGDSLTIAGWEEGLSHMRKGGKALLVIPSSLAYGEEGVEGYIPPCTPFVYKIEVIDIQ